jgi:ABC-type molybdate transport system substrate-binding protein
MTAQPFVHKPVSERQRSIQWRVKTSIAFILAGVGLAYIPIPSLFTRTVVVVSGTELQEPLEKLATTFEQEHPNIQLELKFQGSQDVVNRYLDERNDFKPTVLIPANGEFLNELAERWQVQQGSEPFYDSPIPIAKTYLVAIAWPDRGNVLFPDGRFSWQRLENALKANRWSEIGGPTAWGNFDLMMTDPNRSNSGQLTLGLWAQAKLNSPSLTTAVLNAPVIQPLFSLVKRSVYEPPRSTDILLQEFIARGPNDADVGIVYESIALHRWQESAQNQGKPYQIYYLDQTIETIPTAAIVRRDVDSGTADAARQFLNYLTQPKPQAVLAQFGFRPVNTTVDLSAIPNTPWKQAIPGVQVKPTGQVTKTPNQQVLSDLVRQWERAN